MRGRPPRRAGVRRVLRFGALVLSCLVRAAAAAADVEQALAFVGLSADAASRIRGGDIVLTDVAPASSHELAIGLAFLVERPLADVSADYRAALDMHVDAQVRALARVHGTLADFAGVALPADEAARYLAARPGDQLNLSADEIAAFQAAAAAGGNAHARAQQVLAQVLFERYRAYAAHGLDALAPYARAGGDVRRPSEELRAALAAGVLLRRYAPPVWQMLGAYPQGKPANLDERFYVVTYELNDRPNYALRHRLEVPFGDGGIVVVDRDFYVSHGYNTSQAVSGLIPVAEGTMVFYRDRVSTDQLRGFGSSLKQAVGRRVMASRLTAILQRSRACFQAATMCPLAAASPG
ncbi:MAG: hypothetical protein KIT14_11415 [bacterium]|nr:hypothetical protein [bacterium]